MEKSKYEVILSTMPETENRIEVFFRQAGDGFIQIEYGREQRADILDSFRMLAVDELIKGKNIRRLIETLPGIQNKYDTF